MNIQTSERFDTDVEKQYRWYLVESGLDPIQALDLADRFLEATKEAIEFLAKTPGAGRLRRFAGARHSLMGIA